MKVFLSWSGDRSRRTAEVISTWLKQVVQVLDPWMSTDIQKGKRWGPEVSRELETSQTGIIFLNRDNIDEKWIYFEAGALSKMSTDSYVCTFLLDIDHEDIESPLADFQNTKFEKEDMRRLVHTLNIACSKAGQRALENDVLDDSFDTFWPRIEEKLKSIIDEKPKKSEPVRKQKEILSEILEIVRSLNQRNQMKDFASELADLKIAAQQKGYGMMTGYKEGRSTAVPSIKRSAIPSSLIEIDPTKKAD